MKLMAAADGAGITPRQASIFKTIKFSDHAPITVDYDFSL